MSPSPLLEPHCHVTEIFRKPPGELTYGPELPDGSELPEITPAELAARWDAGDRPAMLDVRELDERAIAHLDGARLVPLATLAGLVESIDPEVEWVVYCHHGVRSAAAVDFLLRHGVRKARNLTGGIDRWSREVDPTVTRY